MPDVLTGVFSLETAVYCFGIFLLVRILRQVFEFYFPKLKTDAQWRGIALVAAPSVLGSVIAALASKYPFPPAFSALSGRTLFGAALGGFSGTAYRIFKVLVKRQFGVEVSISPPPNTDVAVVVIPHQDPPPAVPEDEKT